MPSGETMEDMVAKLPALRLEYERLGALVRALEAFTGEAGDGASDEGGSEIIPPRPPLPRVGNRPPVIRADEFTGMSASTAIRHYLDLVGRGNPKGPRDIAQAFVQGGRDANEDKAYANVTSALKRMNKAGEVKQVRRGQWGLASWYGNSAPRKPAPLKPTAEINAEDLL